MLRSRAATYMLCVLLLPACMRTPAANTRDGLRLGTWRMRMDLNGNELPFLFQLREDNDRLVMHIRNGEEDIAVDDIIIAHDSITVRIPPYDPVFRGIVRNDSTITGLWTYTARGALEHIAFTAHAGDRPRFYGANDLGPDVVGDWEVHFSPGDSANASAATGMFHQQEGKVTGTFATETGDYRYLEGVVRNDSLLLSGFEGAHAYLFRAAIRDDSLIGDFRSGVQHVEPWLGTRNAAWRLQHPDSLTSLTSDLATVDLHFADIDGDSISTTDAAHRGKVVLVQVMGSWCANCMDEAVLFDQFYGSYHEKGLQVMALAFERTDDRTASLRSLERFRKRLGIRYPIVHAGRASAQDVRTTLPFLQDFMSYPTAIIIDRAGHVRRVHTGFYGPGTGDHYVRFTHEFEGFLEGLLAEESVIASSGPREKSARP